MGTVGLRESRVGQQPVHFGRQPRFHPIQGQAENSESRCVDVLLFFICFVLFTLSLLLITVDLIME